MLLAGSVLLVAATPAAAHTTPDPYLYLFVSETTLDGRVELSIDDLEEVLGQSFGADDLERKQRLTSAEAEIQAFVAQHLSVGIDGSSWPITFGAVELFREREDLAFAVVPYVVDVPDDEVPASVELEFSPFLADVDGRNGLLLLTGGWTAGSFDRDAEALITFTEDSAIQTVDFGPQTSWQTVRSGISLGIDHIRTGPDHVLFILALLLPSVLVFREGWRPAPSFGGALWRVLKIATFFTIAHSVTFTLAGMGWLPLPPSKLVEAVIALSIAAAALHNLRPIFPNREWALSFAFGLFHGMGFASLVAELEVSRTSQLLSLLGRNIGIEIGQVVAILVAFPALFLLRRTSWYQPVLLIGSLVLAALSLSWMVERLLEVDLGTDAVVEVAIALPRGYAVAAGATVLAALVHLRQSRQGMLVPVEDPLPAPDELEVPVS